MGSRLTKPVSASDMPYGIDAAKIGGGAVSNTEFGYLDGVTGALQTQINGLLSALLQRLSRLSPVTAGTANAYTLTDASIGTPANGDFFAFRVNTFNNASATIAINGGSALALRTFDSGGSLQFLASGQLRPSSLIIARYDSGSTSVVVVSGYIPVASNIPTTLNGTTFSGISIGTMGATIRRESSTASLNIRGGSGTRESGLTMKARGLANDGAGAVQLSCGMIARTASTTYSNFFPLASTDYGVFYIIDTTMTGNAITVVTVKNGAIVSITGDTACYVTGSPTGDQCQLTVVSDYVVATTGSGYTRTMGANGFGMGST